MRALKLHYNGHEIDQRKDAVELFGGTETKYFAMTAAFAPKYQQISQYTKTSCSTRL